MSESIPESVFYSGAGGEVDECEITLRFFGDNLDPDAVTALLGVEPTDSCRKGDPVLGSWTGRWLLACERTNDTPNHQIRLLLSGLTAELAIWSKLGKAFSSEIKCHLFLHRWTRGTIFSTETLAYISARDLKLHVEIYVPHRVPTNPSGEMSFPPNPRPNGG
jgi:hypothetical protein